VTLDDILDDALACGASDIFLGADEVPRYRITGRLVARGDVPIPSDRLADMLYHTLRPWEIERLDAEHEIDSALERRGDFRFRLNIFLRRGGMAAVIRPIPINIPSPQELGLSEALVRLLEVGNGLILVTGRTGSGKSTMCASFLEYINQIREAHIVTFEDPIEFVFEPRRCTISQRQVGEHTPSYNAALRAVLRQSPDIVYVGEMRDRDTIEATLSIAETGQLVLANLHTSSASQTVHRIVDVFTPAQRAQISVQLANSLNAVICQVLLPRVDGQALVPAREVMLGTPAILNLIRKGEAHQLYSAIESSGSRDMHTMDQSLAGLVHRGLIAVDVARAHAHDIESLESLLRSGSSGRHASTGGW